MTTARTNNVTLVIGGRNHVVSALPGEEAHLLQLARMIDDRVREQGLAHGQTEARMLLFAALVMADELLAARAATAAPSVLPAPPPSDMPAPLPPPVMPESAVTAPEIPPELTARLTALADRVELLANRLVQSGLEHSAEAS